LYFPEDREFKGQTYVQYTGEIPSALLKILVELDDYWSGYTKIAQWGCYPSDVPEKYIQQGISSHFPSCIREIPPEEERGASHIVWAHNVHEYIVQLPVYADGKIYVAVENGIHCFDTHTGEKLWEAQTEDSILHAPQSEEKYVTYQDGRLILTVFRGLLCFDACTGEKLWEITGNPVAGPPLYMDNKVFLRARPEEPYLEQVMGITCLDMYTGGTIWEFTVEETKEYKVCFNQNMLLLNGKIYFGTGKPSIYCLDAASGTIIWEYADSHAYRRLIISGDNLLVIEGWGTGQMVWTGENLPFLLSFHMVFSLSLQKMVKCWHWQ
jgi:outer membrane protein assembly factor BamB